MILSCLSRILVGVMDFSVEKIANLAYLKLKPEEKTAFEKQFKEILSYVDQLQKLPMSADEAKAMGAFHITNAFYDLLKLDPALNLREDDPASSAASDASRLILKNEEALMNAPKSGGLPGELLYEVPSIIDRD